MSSNIIPTQLKTLVDFLLQNKINYSIIHHLAEGKSDEVAKVRGTEVGQGAKALVCKIKENHSPQYLLVVLPGDQQLDFKHLATQIGVKKVSLANIEEVKELTNCTPGTVPPFSFHQDLKLIADPSLFERFEEIAFNAGSLEASIKLKSKDYLKLCAPELLSILKL